MFVNPIALGSIGWKYYFTFVFFLLSFLVVAFFFYPETRGRTLEQVAFIFDPEETSDPQTESKDSSRGSD